MVGTILALSLTADPAAGRQALTADDDREVLFAVVEQSIRPWLALEREIAGLPAGPVSVLPESLRACDSQESSPSTCATVEALRTADDQGFVTGAWDYRDETRRALVDAFNSRNSRSATLSIGDAPRSSDFAIAMSLPGYTSNGFAVVYAHATRGDRARQGWAFILSRASGRWTVQHAYLLWIRQ